MSNMVNCKNILNVIISESETQYGPGREKPCLWRFAKNTGAYQPAHLCSLISTFVIRLLKTSIFKLASCKNINSLASL